MDVDDDEFVRIFDELHRRERKRLIKNSLYKLAVLLVLIFISLLIFYAP